MRLWCFCPQRSLVTGFSLTHGGICRLKPWSKTVDAILKLKPPFNAYEICHLVGMGNYYSDMWPRRTHMLTPFTPLNSGPRKKEAEWTPELDTTFNQLNVVIVKDALMIFPNHNMPFETYTDASDYQMGAYVSCRRGAQFLLIHRS